MGRAGSWYPLSHGQEALWFLWKLVPETWAYNIVLPVTVRGAIDLAALERSLLHLSDRHPSLRTEFREEGGKPWQRAREDNEIHLELIDAAAWPDERLADALRAKAREPFDLEANVTPRVTLFRRRDEQHVEQHVLMIAVHHIVVDLWSLIVLMDELRQIYAAESGGRTIDLPQPALTCEEFVRRQRELLDSEAGEELWRYWRDELAGELAALDLPADHPRPAMQTFAGGTITRRMDAALTSSLKTLAGKERSTLFMALLAAFQALLHRYTGQENFVVGSPTSGRDSAELEGVVGDLVNMVPIRADLSGAPSFRQLLARVRTRVVGTIKHSGYPFSLLVDRLHLTRDLSRSPMFQTTFVLQKFQRFQELSHVMLPANDEPAIPFAGLLFEPMAFAQQDGQFDVNLEMKEDDRGRLVGAWKYSSALFDAATIERMAQHFETLLRDIVADPDRPIDQLRLLSENESHEAIIDGEASRQELPVAATVCELFEAQAARRGEMIALRCGEATLTYAELHQRVLALARHLVTLGVGRDRLVAVLLPRGLDFVTALLAISKAGGAFLPLDSRHPISRTLQILETSAAQVVLTSGDVAQTMRDAIRGRTNDPAIAVPIVLDVLNPADATAEQSDVVLPAVDPSDLAYVMFTSGSTGTPKGVMVEHRGMINHVLAKLSDLGVGEDDVLAQNGPPTFDIVVWQCLAPLVVGGEVAIFSDELAEDPGKLLNEIEQRGVTVIQLVPSMLHAVIEEAASRGNEAPVLSTLRWMVPTGEALPTELARRWLALYPHIPLLNTYGSTECSDDQCHYVLERLRGADDSVAIVSIGKPIHNMTAHVLDENLAPVPIGVVGELYIGGLGVGRGYLGDPQRTATAFIRDPFSDEPNARLYRTRDRARRRADGNLDFLQRTDDVIKLRGLRIEPGEIEAALTRHPAISAAAVSVRENPAGERLLAGYLVPTKTVAKEQLPAGDELRRFLADHLPQSMIPAIFVALDALPLSANGKLDRKRLPAPEWGAGAQQELIAPRTATEARIAAIWAEVLGAEQVGVTQDFFAIGGDSIRSIQIVARCKRANLHVRPSDLFQHSTVAALAALAERNSERTDDAGASQPFASLEISQEHLDLAFGQVAFDEE